MELFRTAIDVSGCFFVGLHGNRPRCFRTLHEKYAPVRPVEKANRSLRSEDEHLPEVIAAVPAIAEPLPISARVVLPDDRRLGELEIRTTVYEDEDQTQETRNYYLSTYRQEFRFLTDGLKKAKTFQRS